MWFKHFQRAQTTDIHTDVGILYCIDWMLVAAGYYDASFIGATSDDF